MMTATARSRAALCRRATSLPEAGQRWPSSGPAPLSGAPFGSTSLSPTQSAGCCGCHCDWPRSPPTRLVAIVTVQISRGCVKARVQRCCFCFFLVARVQLLFCSLRARDSLWRTLRRLVPSLPGMDCW